MGMICQSCLLVAALSEMAYSFKAMEHTLLSKRRISAAPSKNGRKLTNQETKLGIWF